MTPFPQTSIGFLFHLYQSAFVLYKGMVRMDVTVLTQLVGSLGFPIVACFYLFYMHNKSEERHKEEVERLAESVDNNTKALNKLIERLGD